MVNLVYLFHLRERLEMNGAGLHGLDSVTVTFSQQYQSMEGHIGEV